MRFSASGHRRRPAPFHVSVFVEIQTIFDLFGVSTAMANTPFNGITNGLPPSSVPVAYALSNYP